MRQFSTEAIILRRTNYGEADRIISLLTPDHGKISVIAKGVRRPKSKLAGGLELLAICNLTVLMGKSDLGVVTSSRIKKFYSDILHDYDRLQLAYSAIKKVNTITETIDDKVFFELLASMLEYLGNLNIDWRLVAVWFNLRVADMLGIGVNLSTDKSGVRLSADKNYGYDNTAGVFYQHDAGRFNSDHIKLLRLLATKTPITVSQVGGLEAISWLDLLTVGVQD